MKKKVLMISCKGLGNGGVQAVIMGIVRRLSYKYTFDIVLFTDDKGYYEDEFLKYGGKIYRITSNNNGNIIRKKIVNAFFSKQLYKEILNIIKLNGPYCAIHCNNYYESAFCLLAATKCGIPVRIAHVHDIMHHSNFIIELYRRKRLKIINQYATHKIGCSEAACISMFGTNSGAKVMMNAYNNHRFDPLRFTNSKSENLTLIQIGNFSHKKNQLFSIHVFYELLKKYPSAKLWFVGFDVEGYKDKMEMEIQRLNLKNNVELLPHDADTPSLLSKAHIALVPSLFEGFGIVAVESQAMGVHCFASDALPKSTDAGGCTYLALSLGVDEWAKQIDLWYQTNKDIAQKYDCSRYKEETIIEEYDCMYDGKNILF